MAKERFFSPQTPQNDKKVPLVMEHKLAQWRNMVSVPPQVKRLFVVVFHFLYPSFGDWDESLSVSITCIGRRWV